MSGCKNLSAFKIEAVEETLFCRPLRQLLAICYVPVKSKLEHPPGSPPGAPRAFEFLENFWKIPPSRGRKAVQMPHYRSIPGDQIPPPPGTFQASAVYVNMV